MNRHILGIFLCLSFLVSILVPVSASESTTSIEPIQERVVQWKNGGLHTIALTDNGRVFAWGSNSFGELGDGTKQTKSTPVEITDGFPESSKVTQIEVKYSHSFAVTADGELYAWGDNREGQLGDGTTIGKTVPIKIFVPGKITQLLAGLSHTIVLTEEGKVFAWGSNQEGQLGDGTIVDEYFPTEITGQFPDVIIQLAGGRNHTLALSGNGRVFSWGDNYYGQLGDGTTSARGVPTEITYQFDTYGTVSQVAVADYTSFALTDTGNVLSWGQNNYGHLGNGTAESSVHDHPVPITYQFDGKGTVIQLIANQHNQPVLALTDTKRVFVWGGMGNPRSPLEITDKFIGYDPIKFELSDMLSVVAYTNNGETLSFYIPIDGVNDATNGIPLSFFLPSTPLSASKVTTSSVNLSWPTVQGAESYYIYQDGVKLAELEVPTTEYEVMELESGNYHFGVSALIDGQESLNRMETKFELSEKADELHGNRDGSVEVSFNHNDAIMLELDTNEIDFGDINPIIGTIEKSPAITTTVRSNTIWSLLVSGTDFSDGDKIISVENLSIRNGQEDYGSIKNINETLLQNQAQTDRSETSWDMNLDVNWFDPASDNEFESTLTFTALGS